MCLKGAACTSALKPSPGVGRDLPPWQCPTAVDRDVCPEPVPLSGDLIAWESALTNLRANRINYFIAFQIRYGDTWSLKDSEGKDSILES